MRLRIGFLFFALGLVIVLPAAVFAQTAAADLAISWRTKNYVPPGFIGKSLPGLGAPIELAVQALANGRVVDLSKFEIRWFLNNRLLDSGVGLIRTAFVTDQFTNQDYAVKVYIVNYPARPGIEKTILIPVVAPRLVIDAPYPDLKISKVKSFFTAWPYFFSVADVQQLTFEWRANGLSSKNGQNLTLAAAGGSTGDALLLSVEAVNTTREIERANHTINLTLR